MEDLILSLAQYARSYTCLLRAASLQIPNFWTNFKQTFFFLIVFIFLSSTGYLSLFN